LGDGSVDGYIYFGKVAIYRVGMLVILGEMGDLQCSIGFVVRFLFTMYVRNKILYFVEGDGNVGLMIVVCSLNSFIFSEYSNEGRGYRAQPCADRREVWRSEESLVGERRET
jgi:hypothetical protein